MEQKILTIRQQKALVFFSNSSLALKFYFSGGTALAEYYLHHRLSDDLDFFTPMDIDINSVRSFVNTLSGELSAHNVEYTKIHDRHLFFLKFGGEVLKLEFTRYPFPRLGRRVKHGGILVDSLRDLSANKLMALLDRFDPKDFVDIYFILKKRSLKNIRNDAQKKFGMKLKPLFVAAEFAKVRRVAALPVVLKSLTVEQLKTFFEKQIKELGASFITLG
jgi:predicted nucleotidyltransferase component of viral defense system